MSTCYVKLCLCMCVSLHVYMCVRAPVMRAYVTSSKQALSSKQLHRERNCSFCLLVTQSLSILCVSNFFIPHSWRQVTDSIPNPPYICACPIVFGRYSTIPGSYIQHIAFSTNLDVATSYDSYYSTCPHM